MKKNKRWDYLIEILKSKEHKICAEIGVWKGDFAFNLLNNLPSIKVYHCVDLWKHYEDHTKTLVPNGKMATSNMEEIYKNFKNKASIYNKKVIIHRMTSAEAAKIIPDNELDFIFIDANHAYEYVKEDIKLWLPKVKSGGVISGHDYGNHDDDGRFGVTRAVKEEFEKFEIGPNHVWWTIK